VTGSTAAPAYNSIATYLASPAAIGGTTAAAGTFTALIGKTSLTAGVAGTTAGVLNLEGSTSGAATITAPAVAGTSSNAVVSSNVLNAPGFTGTSVTLTDTAANPDLNLGLTNYTLAVTSSPIFTIAGSYESASTPTYAKDSWTLSDVIATGVNGISQLTFNHSGSTAYGIAFPFVNAVSSANNFSQILIDSTAGATVTGASASTGIGFRSHVLALQNWYFGTGGNVADWFRIDNLTQNVDGLDITSGVPQVQVISLGLCASTASCTADTGISRASAGVVDIGNGTAGNATGTLKAAAHISTGTTFTSSGGLDETTLVGGATAGKFTTATVTSGSTVITMGNSATAPNGWHCSASDITHPLDIIVGTSASTTTALLTVASSITAGDVIEFSCMGY
jgi:hypothetical protein